MRNLSIQEAALKFVEEKEFYFKQWIFDEPIVVSKKHNDGLKQLQKIMYKLIIEFVTNYEKYQKLMPVSKEVAEIIHIFNRKEYKIGTYRTDFVYDDKNQVKIIEITCRFALNGMFFSTLFNKLAEDYRLKNMKSLLVENSYDAIFQHFENYLEGVDSIAILKGDDVRNESKIYADIFKRMGYPVNEIAYNDISTSLDSLKKAWVISELSFDEITSLGIDLIEKLMPLNIINDFRTIFLIHDKRFFSVLGNKELQELILTTEEIVFFDKFYIPTYTSFEKMDLWNSAKVNKDAWIIKHRSLGKSQKIYAGIVTDQVTWEALFESDDFKDFILQEWIPQKKILGNIGTEKYEDYVTGTLLFFDDNYFGFGDFRTSSFPVTNKGDHRKACSLISADDTKIDVTKITNYIN
ncbi:hypothetical protein [Flavicella sediminum]|uniref:hypothetical protein n=1 Tax=Flavicella sediminum TaxID=2585141 RepID=UPI0011208210|nr:hypothetical protein [Flavicella sediminum]